MNHLVPRRAWVWAAVWLSVFLAAPRLHAEPAAAKQSFSREAMLRDLAQRVIAHGYANLAAQARALADEIAQFNKAPGPAALERTRQAWTGACTAADLLRCFQTGPIADREVTSLFYYWQIVPNRIERIVSDPAQKIDQALLDNGGATVKGLYAVEYLLFDTRGGQAAEVARALDLLSASQRRREYLAAVARDVAEKAAQVAGDWAATGGQGAVEKFAAAGQATVNVLVNQLTQSLENTFQNHLNLVLMLPAPIERQLNRIKGSRSGSSLQNVIITLEGIEKFYRGDDGLGLSAAVSQLNPALAKRVQDQFTAALGASREVGAPLEQAAVDKRDTVQKAVDQVHALEILFKVDVASALGVTITFTSGDGD